LIGVSLVIKDGNNEVRFSSGVVNELRDMVGDITLKNLTEPLGWEYKNVKKDNGVTKMVIVKFNDLIDFLKSYFEKIE